MTDFISAIGGAMRLEAETLRAISQNVANVQTPAYRRQVAVNHSDFNQLVGAQARTSSANELLPQDIDIPQLSLVADLKPSGLKSTGEPLHVALGGAGFFVVQSPQGLALTRRGDFKVNADGVLSTADGDPVLGESGSIQLGSDIPTISSDGSVSVNGTVVDRLRLVNVSDAASLKPLGNGLYKADTDSLIEGDRASVQQGFLETSNVAPVHELLQLMETVRRFEAEQKFARAYDGMLDKAISELGKI